MTPRPAAAGRGGGAYGRFAATAAAVVLLLAAAGWVPTRRLAGEGGSGGRPPTPAQLAMLAGCAIGLAASLAGGLPIALGERRRTRQTRRPAVPPALRALAGTAIRLGVAAALVVAAALSGRFAVGPLVAWTAASYLALLPVDTRYALAAARAEAGGAGRDFAGGEPRDGRDAEELER